MKRPSKREQCNYRGDFRRSKFSADRWNIYAFKADRAYVIGLININDISDSDKRSNQGFPNLCRLCDSLKNYQHNEDFYKVVLVVSVEPIVSQ